MELSRFSQRDSRWSNKRIGSSARSIGAWGCAVTCLAILTGKTPAEIADTMQANGGFVNGGDVSWYKAVELFGLVLDKDRTKQHFTPCIAATNKFAPSYPNHFFVLLENNQIIDPLDGQLKTNPYNIVGYRNITTKEEPVTLEQEIRVKIDGLEEAFLNRGLNDGDAPAITGRTEIVMNEINNGKPKHQALNAILVDIIRNAAPNDKETLKQLINSI